MNSATLPQTSNGQQLAVFAHGGPDVATPNDISDYLLAEARVRGDLLTNLKLQKLLYYAQAWHLVHFEKPIFSEDFEAWVHGPVLLSQYHRFLSATWGPIVEPVALPSLNAELTDHLYEMLNVFGSESAIALELMTFEEAPWKTARQNLAPYEECHNVISKESMAEFYRSLRR